MKNRSWLSLAAVIAAIALITGSLLLANTAEMYRSFAGTSNNTGAVEELVAAEEQGTADNSGDQGDPSGVQETEAAGDAGDSDNPGSAENPGAGEGSEEQVDPAAAEEPAPEAAAAETPEEAQPQGPASQIRLSDNGPAPVRSLLGCAVFMDAPDVDAGDDLYAKAVISGIYGRAVCRVDWYYDGAPMDGYTGQYLITEDGTAVSASVDIEYSEDMQTEHTIGLMATYTDPATGHTEHLYNQANVTVHNYSKAYYVRKQNEEAIRNASSSSEVSSVYKGNYSSSYNVDYSTEVKTSFINDGGYSSSTNYLVWVNLATQKVNVFQGSKGSWELIHTWRCATGAPDTPTPKGVTYTTYKQTGWITEEYQVKYVTRFYPGSGYAFHSILYTPDGSSVQSGAVGYPKSHGCVRTEDEGVRWIYNNLPAHSTVVIY